jgi:predicted permease
MRAIFRRRAVEREMDEELRFHLGQQTEKYVAAGLARGEAARRARIELGGLEQAREGCRDARGTRWLENLAQDVRYALRLLRRSPAFTAVAILSLALGIGANTAIFTLLDGLVLRDLNVPHPEELVRFGAHFGEDPDVGLSLPMFDSLRRDQRVFSSVFAWWGDGVFNAEANGTMLRADIWAVTGNFHSELGATPELGRLIEPSDVNLQGEVPSQVAVLSFEFWKRNYGGARDVVGKTLRIEGLPFTIVGVTREGFTGFSAEGMAQVTVPLTAEPLILGKNDVQKHLRRPAARWLEAAGRLKPGTTLQQANAQLESIWPGIQQELEMQLQSPAELTGLRALRLKIESGGKGASFLRGRFGHPLLVLLAVSGLVALVACVNLASLLLARAASRNHELSVRVALGARRARLARQMLTESVTLSAAGTLAGFALAQWASRALASLIIGEIYIVPAALNLSPDLRVLGFTTAAAVLTGVIFGLVPAWRASRADPITALQHNVQRLGSGTGRLGKGLIVAQVALSVMLLAGAGLFLRSLHKLRDVDPGYRTGGLLVAHLFPVPGGYKDFNWAEHFRQVTERVSALPGIAAAGLIHMEPGSVARWTEQIRPTGATQAGVESDFEMVMPGAVRALGIPIVRGREFTWQDDPDKPHVAVVSQSFATKFFPGEDALGKQLEIISEPKWQAVEIVGILGDASLYDIRQTSPPTVYVPAMQYGDWMVWSELLVRSQGSPAAVGTAVRKEVESFGRESVMSVRPVSEEISRSILKERITAILSAFFGGLALLLAAIGLYGLMAYSVTHRTREIGIRLALGAQRSAVCGMVLGETFALAALGLAIGVPCAVGASQLIAGMLYGVAGHDVPTLAGVCLVLAAAAGLAGYLPARRAMRLDPMTSLRQE